LLFALDVTTPVVQRLSWNAVLDLVHERVGRCGQSSRIQALARLRANGSLSSRARAKISSSFIEWLLRAQGRLPHINAKSGRKTGQDPQTE
jgi:hypothetical protein